jgi:PPM family protein phosphatase
MPEDNLIEAADRASDGALFFLREDMREGRIVPFAGGTAGVFSSKSPGKSSDSEDAAALLPFGDAQQARGVLAIADGMGGQPGGALAAGLALQALHDSVREADLTDESALRGAILNGFEEANRAVKAIGVGAATTLTVVEMQEHCIRPYHAGDSLIIVLGQRGRIKLQTVSHGPVGYAVEAGLLKEAEAMHHADRHLVSNMVGMTDMRIDIGPSVELAPLDTLLIASDGLFDNLHTEEIIELARKGPIEQVVHNLAEVCRKRMAERVPGQPSKPDDLTFIAYRRGGKEPEGNGTADERG